MMGTLDGKIALVTGASRGIGAAIAQRFGAEGATVVVTARTLAGKGSDYGGQSLDGSVEEVAQTIRDAGGQALGLRCDVGDPASRAEAADEVLNRFGRLDILVNNAGVAHVNKPVTEITEAEYDRVFDVNVKGLFLFSQAMVPVFRRQGGGVMINIGSTAGLRPRPGLSAYNATKGAVHNLTKTLAVELAPDKIRVCAIAPVATETPLLPTFLGPAAGQRQKFEATVPLGRLAQPQDIANVALFLASDEAAFVTGNIVEVDGGRCV
jgi:3-oxoacyl-[acyl-carrier protein] reductase